MCLCMTEVSTHLHTQSSSSAYFGPSSQSSLHSHTCSHLSLMDQAAREIKPELTCILLLANLSIHSGKEVQTLLGLGVVLTKQLLPQLGALKRKTTVRLRCTGDKYSSVAKLLTYDVRVTGSIPTATVGEFSSPELTSHSIVLWVS